MSPMRSDACPPPNSIAPAWPLKPCAPPSPTRADELEGRLTFFVWLLIPAKRRKISPLLNRLLSPRTRSGYETIIAVVQMRLPVENAHECEAAAGVVHRTPHGP